MSTVLTTEDIAKHEAVMQAAKEESKNVSNNSEGEDTQAKDPSAEGTQEDENSTRDGEAFKATSNEEDNSDSDGNSDDSEESEVEKLKAEIESLKKRYSDVQAYRDRTINEMQKEVDEAKTTTAKIPETDADIEAFKESNPNAYKALVKIAQKELETSVSDFAKKVESLEGKANKAERKSLLEEVKLTHPDAGTIQKDSGFKEWFEMQSKGIQSLMMEGATVGEINEGLSIYKRAVGIKTKADKKATEVKDSEMIDSKSKAGSSSKKGKTSYLYTESELINMSEEEYSKPEVQKAKAEGKVLYGA